jgi:hypothetical protein
MESGSIRRVSVEIRGCWLKSSYSSDMEDVGKYCFEIIRSHAISPLRGGDLEEEQTRKHGGTPWMRTLECTVTGDGNHKVWNDFIKHI